MNLNELKKLSSAPAEGQMLAYLQKKVIYVDYVSLDDAKQQLENARIENGELLELHMFDKSKEYRAIASESPRYANGFIEHIAEFEEDEMETYVQEMLTEEGKNLKVLNHISYTENGMALIDDFRMVI